MILTDHKPRDSFLTKSGTTGSLNAFWSEFATATGSNIHGETYGHNPKEFLLSYPWQSIGLSVAEAEVLGKLHSQILLNLQ